MKIKERHYPHPVLWKNSDDYQECYFKTDVSIDVEQDHYVLNADFTTSSGNLRELVISLKANYAIHLECSNTRYREIFRFNKTRESFTIPSNMLDGKVEMTTFILANDYISDYKDKHFHQDFGDLSFEIWKGDVLAVGDELSFDADLIHDPLRRIPSIFSIQKSTNKEPLDISSMSNKIVINLSEQNFNMYNSLRQAENLQPVLASLVIVPALASVLEDIKLKGEMNDEEEFDQMEEESRWFRVLKRKLKDNFNIDIKNISGSTSDSSLVIAQKLVGDPVSSALQSLYEFEAEND
ncbi:hypothetical protein [Aquibacillus sediminis]|uniref:hypothetical protein n=1 Tax=Aquibacillus sediminis TaxID=2574734 RepID=UPI0011082AEA|nr:hypothetical protein [Aquibacillus sediminis]